MGEGQFPVEKDLTELENYETIPTDMTKILTAETEESLAAKIEGAANEGLSVCGFTFLEAGDGLGDEYVVLVTDDNPVAGGPRRGRRKKTDVVILEDSAPAIQSAERPSTEFMIRGNNIVMMPQGTPIATFNDGLDSATIRQLGRKLNLNILPS